MKVRCAGRWEQNLRIHKKKVLAGILAVMLSFCACCITACSLLTPNTGSSNQNTALSAGDTQKDTGFILTGPDSYDSADTAVLVSKNKEENSVTFLNLALGRKYTLSIEGTTTFFDKYGYSISLDQIETGSVVDLTFLKSKKRLNSMQISSEAWSYEKINRYDINTVRNELTVGEDIYKFNGDTILLSEDRQIEMIDMNAVDVLTVRGIGTTVHSIKVEQGHGYLRLVNDEQFIGGWIEIGKSMIRRITEDMLLTVPEGSYQVLISLSGGGGIKNVVINRNEEVTLDIGDLDVAEIKYGTVIFSMTPSGAALYIDGTQADTSQPVTLEYGIHQLIAKAAGYQTVTSYLKVGEETAGIDVVLDAVEGEIDEEESTDTQNTDTSTDSTGTTNTASSNTASANTASANTGNSDTTTATSYYKVYIDAPEGAEIYLDGNYIGISPCSFKKTSGAHVITLRKSGYATRSYTIQIDEEKKDISYSFAELVESISE